MALQIGQPLDHDFDEPLGLLSDCHRRIEHFLDVLRRIEQVAAGRSLTPDEWRQIEGALRYFETAGPRHTADEEQSLFPRLRASGDASAERALRVLGQLEREHQMVDSHHQMINILCRRWLDHDRLSEEDARDLRDRLGDLQSIYREHIAIEDRQLFPVAKRLLSSADLHDIGLEMAARRRRIDDL
jgi:hemerythrin-like domain-containing protein